METVRRAAAAILATGLAVAPVPAPAADFGNPYMDEPQSPSLLDAARKAVKAGDYQGAIPLLRQVIKDDPRSADALNNMGFSLRKLGELKAALGWYQKALAIDPDHRGADEYLGELYLQTGQMAKAKQQLERLDAIYFFGCEEFDGLKQAIVAYKPKP